MKSQVFNISYEQLFSATEKALIDLEMVVDEKSFDGQYILARTRSSLLSWGEHINISFELTEDRKVKVVIESKSSAQLIDWGTNDKNETRLMSQLKSVCNYR